MAIYGIGDVQGCAVALEELLDAVGFSPGSDSVWLTGDLVNRGPASLETLRLVKRLGRSAVTVLGNHDLHLLAVAAGARHQRDGDTLTPILRAPDRDELLDWLRHRPLAHFDGACGALMTHAGIYPGWRRKQVLARAAEVEALLRGDEHPRFLARMYGGCPARWRDAGSRWQRARFIANALTRMRFCGRRGELNFTHKGAPGSAPRALVPWFEHPQLRCKKWRIVFGHWSALGFRRFGRVISLDSGCVWGGKLTAVRLDGDGAGKYWQSACRK